MYYWIRESWQLEDTIIGTPDLGNDDINFLAGKFIGEKFSTPIEFETSYGPGSMPHHYFDYGTAIPVISKLFLNVLRESIADNFQVFPAILRNSEKKAEWQDYFAFNVIGIINATDLNASEYGELMPGNEEGISGLGSFTSLALREDDIKDQDMFREPYGNNLIFSERLVKHILKFSPPEGLGIIAHKVVLT